uniref:DUF1758 domain-containing protein n=1 Tax=Caenorhabditis tropicalis TaxID=1561998 RepID=A0A1I7U6Z4_9PELO
MENPIVMDELEGELKAMPQDDVMVAIKRLEAKVDSLEKGLRKIISIQSVTQTTLNTIESAVKDEWRVGVSEPKKPKMSCTGCKGNHEVFECPNLPTGERIMKCIGAGICINCHLHHGGDCRRKGQCAKCNGKHKTCYHI